MFLETVALRATHFGGAMFDAFKLKNQFIRMVVPPTEELAPVVRKNSFDACIVLLKERLLVFVRHMCRRQRQLAGV
jgi:hypothetical protein